MDWIGGRSQAKQIPARALAWTRRKLRRLQAQQQKFVGPLEWARRRLNRLKPQEPEYDGLTNKETFDRIYHQNAWGHSKQRVFFSGGGSHEPAVVNAYVEAVNAFLEDKNKPSVVDLGCGDFNVGSKLLQHTGKYLACDIVEPLIEENKRLFSQDGLEFRVLDITSDELPYGDVVFVREVLQHLSNDSIKRFTQKLRCKYLVVSEMLPLGKFTPNLNKPSGPGIRLNINSGVDLTRPPFDLPTKSETTLCEFTRYKAKLRTVVYEMDAYTDGLPAQHNQ